MTPSSCRNVMDGPENGADQFAAGGSLPFDDVDRKRDRSSKAHGCHTACGQPAAPGLPGALEDGAVRKAWHRTGTYGCRNGALHGGRTVVRRPRTDYCRSRGNPQPPNRYAPGCGPAGSVQRLPAKALRAIPDGATEPQSIVLWRDLTDRRRLGA